MNEAGRDVLVKAALDGVPQAFGTYSEGDARCAMAVLGEAIGVRLRGRCRVGTQRVCRAFNLRNIMLPCPQCTRFGDEEWLIQHFNDDHHFDFLTIARKLGPDAA